MFLIHTYDGALVLHVAPGGTSLEFQLRLERLPGNYSTYHHQAPRTQNGFERKQTWMELQTTGLHRRPRGRNRWCLGNVRGIKLNDTQTHQYTREERTIILKKPTLWANVLGFYSQALEHRRPWNNGETLSRRGDVWLLITRSVGMRSMTDALKWSHS